MPRKSPDALQPKGAAAAPVESKEATTTTETVSVSVAPVAAPMAATPPAAGYHSADINGDGIVDAEEKAMELEFRRKALEDADAMRDAQRKMAWFALFGMLLYPFAVVLAVFANLEQAGDILGSMAATYFVSVAAIVAAFFGGQAYAGKASSTSRSK